MRYLATIFACALSLFSCVVSAADLPAPDKDFPSGWNYVGSISCVPSPGTTIEFRVYDRKLNERVSQLVTMIRKNGVPLEQKRILFIDGKIDLHFADVVDGETLHLFNILNNDDNARHMGLFPKVFGFTYDEIIRCINN